LVTYSFSTEVHIWERCYRTKKCSAFQSTFIDESVYLLMKRYLVTSVQH